MKAITGRMLIGAGELSAISAFMAEFPNGCEPTPENLKRVVALEIDLVAWLKDLAAQEPEEVQILISEKYNVLDLEEKSIQKRYTDARDELRTRVKAGEISRTEYLESCGDVRQAFYNSITEFKSRASEASYRVMSEFLMGLSD